MLLKWAVPAPALCGGGSRCVHVYLPEDYDEEPDARYPVLYMFDGQNVFLDEEASFGRSWRMLDYMQFTRTPLIIVAPESCREGNGRLEEYSPFTHQEDGIGLIPGRGRASMDWLVGTLKPLVDMRLRTLPDRDSTLIAGSSMGGLMSLFAACTYNGVFSRAASLSPSLWVSPARVHRMLQRARIAPDTVLYMDYGEIELGNHEGMVGAFLAAGQSLYSHGVNLTFRIVPGGTHSEESWETRLPAMMACLGL